jgi:7-cyano-7-deazaguanine reductase
MNTNNIDKVLGQRVDSPTTYTPDILVREERQRNRTYLNIQNDNLPFVGYDIWNGYECSAMTENGLPVACVAKVVYPATNPYIVESKSMKLYWNGFNMQPMGKNVKEVLKNIKATAEKDLSALLETDVKVQLYSQTLDSTLKGEYVTAAVVWEEEYTSQIHPWETLEEIAGAEDTKFDVFNETPDLLEVFENKTVEFSYYRSTLLRSNCKITKQPDSGDIYIYYRGKKQVTANSLLKWIVSFRNECHFHEEICEAAYKRLWDVLQPKELLVTCFYARRGGWDIVPTRANKKSLLDSNLINPKSPYFKFPRQ